MIQKGFAPILIVVAVVIVAGIGFVALQSRNNVSTPSPTPQESELNTATPLSTSNVEPTSKSVSKSTPTPKAADTSKPTPTSAPVATQKPQITIGVNGIVYRDQNCNRTQDSGEGGISGVTVTISQNPGFNFVANTTTNSSGNYSWSQNINADSTFGAEVSLLAPDGYKDAGVGNYATGLSASYKTAVYNLPLVPNENIGQCQ